MSTLASAGADGQDGSAAAKNAPLTSRTFFLMTEFLVLSLPLLGDFLGRILRRRASLLLLDVWVGHGEERENPCGDGGRTKRRRAGTTRGTLGTVGTAQRDGERG